MSGASAKAITHAASATPSIHHARRMTFHPTRNDLALAMKGAAAEVKPVTAKPNGCVQRLTAA